MQLFLCRDNESVVEKNNFMNTDRQENDELYNTFTDWSWATVQIQRITVMPMNSLCTWTVMLGCWLQVSVTVGLMGMRMTERI